MSMGVPEQSILLRMPSDGQPRHSEATPSEEAADGSVAVFLDRSG